MRRTIAPLPVDHQHRHSQPISAVKATSSTIKVSSGTVMAAGSPGDPGKASEICIGPLVSEFHVSLSLSVQLRGITLETTGACQGSAA